MSPRRHLLLIGLSGSGKSTVGPLLAGLLDTHATDIDRVIERSAGLSIPDVFTEMGEAEFRLREHRGVLEALALPPHVIAPGGGWAAQPGHLDEVAARVFTFYLRLAPEVAADRLNGALDRPLLRGERPVDALRAQLGRREPWYLAADAIVDATPPAEQVAELLAELARERAGW